MSTNDRMTVQQRVTDTFYWIGMAMSVLCIGLESARNTELVWRLEHANFPLSWAVGLMAILAFLASEYWYPAPSKVRATRDVPAEVSESLPWETEFADR
jgi:hypothetical protein